MGYITAYSINFLIGCLRLGDFSWLDVLWLPFWLLFSHALFGHQVELPPPDLGPTGSLNQTLSLLREVLASHDSSVVPLDARQADFAQVTCLTPTAHTQPDLPDPCLLPAESP